MWIYIPDLEENKEAWVGTISSHDGPNSWWGFELIRHTDVNDMYRTAPFDNQSTVIGLLDHQRHALSFARWFIMLIPVRWACVFKLRAFVSRVNFKLY